MEAPCAAAACTRAAGDMLAVPSSVPGDAQQRVAAGPQPCELDAGADRRLRGSNALHPMVLSEGFLRSSLRTSGRSAQSCAGSTPTSSMRPGACVAGTHWSSPPIPSHPHQHPHLSPPHSPPPGQAGGLLPSFCAAISTVVFALRRAMDAGRAGLVSLAIAMVCRGKVRPAFAPLWPAGVKRWVTAVSSERTAVPALRRAGKTRSTRALQVHRRALGWLEMAQTRCGPGRRIKHPRSAGRRGSGHALRSLVHLVLLSAASGWRLPSSQQAPPDVQAMGVSQRENADRDNAPPPPAAARVAIAGQVRGARRAASAVTTISGCTSDWSVSLPRAPPFSCAPNRAAACCPQRPRRSLLIHEL